MAIELLNIDCMEYMKTLPDKAFDLAVVDPPYGLDIAKKFGDASGKMGKCAKKSDFAVKDWDLNVPSAEYFTELFRVSKEQIIWGWNYYVMYLNECPSYIVWNKKANGNFADCETAWYSKKMPAKVFEFTWNGMIQGNMKNKEERVHPTQKPKALYKWLFENYAEAGFKILDTHLGSGNSAIVADKMGFDFVGCELDKDYYEQAVARHKEAMHLGLFQTPPSSGEGSEGAFLKLFDDEAK